MSNIIGQNPERDKAAKRKIYGKYYIESTGVSVLYGIASLFGMNPGASMKLKYSEKQKIKKKCDQAWQKYCQTGEY